MSWPETPKIPSSCRRRRRADTPRRRTRSRAGGRRRGRRGCCWGRVRRILGVEIEVNGGDEQISLGGVCLAAVAVWSFAGHDGMRRPEIESILPPKRNDELNVYKALTVRVLLAVGCLTKRNPPPNSLPVVMLPTAGPTGSRVKKSTAHSSALWSLWAGAE